MNRRTFLVAGVACAVMLSAPAGADARQANAQSEQQVRKAESDRFAAMLKGDAASLDKLLAAELTYTHGDGRVVDKAVFIAELKTGDFKYVTIQPDEAKVRIYGDIAIVNGTAAMSVVNKGAPAKIRIAYTTAHVRRGGAWQMVAWHATRLAQ